MKNSAQKWLLRLESNRHHRRFNLRIYVDTFDEQRRLSAFVLHDLILGQASYICVHSHGHSISASRSLVLDEAQTEWTTTILISRELGDGGVGVLSRVEANNTSSAGASIWLVLDLGLLDFANGGEQLYEIFIAG